MGSKLNDNDAKALFAVADEDNSGTLSIDEFFTNFRHDKWTREKFFWNTQAGGNSSLNLNRNQRHELVKKIAKKLLDAEMKISKLVISGRQLIAIEMLALAIAAAISLTYYFPPFNNIDDHADGCAKN